MLQSFFYDEQVKRFLLQFIRIFSNFQVEFGRDADGNKALYQVPIKYGDPSRQAAAINSNNSENTLLSTPQMSVNITDFSYDRERVQDPTYIDKITVRQKEYNDVTNTYTDTQYQAYTIERVMPAPYKMNLKLDIWTSNVEQKLQLLEQILVFFNPVLEIQNTDNFLDWTSLSYVSLENVIWTSRSIPTGTESDIDVATLEFTIPIWLTAPAKIKKLGVVQKIIASVYNSDGNLNSSLQDQNLMGNRMRFAPLDYGLLLINGQARLLHAQEGVINSNNTIGLPVKTNTSLEWLKVINLYGKITNNANITNGISQIRLTKENGLEVVGTIAISPTDPYVLLVTIDPETKPTDTIGNLTAVIDPLKSGPGVNLPVPTAPGIRYLILNDTGNPDPNPSPDETYYPVAWTGTGGMPLIARANDIIEWNGTYWEVMFDSNSVTTLQYVTNSTTGIQYKWTGTDWVKSYEGEYLAGYWSLLL